MYVEVYKLGVLCNIYSGIIQQTFRKNKDFEEYEILELKDMDQFGEINFKSLKKILAPKDIKSIYLIREDDILIKAKSSLKTAGIVEEPINRKILFSSQYYLIRIKDEYKNKVSPKYLLWFLNNSKTQEIIKMSSLGSRISFLKSSFLKNLEVLLPSVEKQNEIAELHMLLTKREKLENELLQLYRKEKKYIDMRILLDMEKAK